MAKKRKKARKSKACRTVKGGGCLCGSKFAKRSRCGKGKKRKSRKGKKR